MARLVATIARRVERLLRRRGLVPEEDVDAPADPMAENAPALAALSHASVMGRSVLGRWPGAPVLRLGRDPDAPWATSSGPRHAHLQSFDLHANRTVRAADRIGVEKLCRYLLRPPLGQERLEILPDGQICTLALGLDRCARRAGEHGHVGGHGNGPWTAATLPGGAQVVAGLAAPVLQRASVRTKIPLVALLTAGRVPVAQPRNELAIGARFAAPCLRRARGGEGLDISRSLSIDQEASMSISSINPAATLNQLNLIRGFRNANRATAAASLAQAKQDRINYVALHGPNPAIPGGASNPQIRAWFKGYSDMNRQNWLTRVNARKQMYADIRQAQGITPNRITPFSV